MNTGGKVWQQFRMFGTFQKAWLISFLIYYLDVSVSEYLLEGSSIKVLEDKKRQNDDTLH